MRLNIFEKVKRASLMASNSNFLENTAAFLQVKSFLFPLLRKDLVPKDAHVLTDALVQSPENVILVEVKLC